MAPQTPGFLALGAVVMLAYYAVPGRYQWRVLLLGSLGFYLLAGRRYIGFLGITILSAYGVTRLFARNLRRDKTTAKRKNRPWLIACLGLNFGALLFCKACLTEPFAEAVQNTGGWFLTLGLPLGMSFYCFQTMGYVLDVYRDTCPAEANLGKLVLFTSYFPQLIQGPISRGRDLLPQLTSSHPYDKRTVSFGLQRMLWGYFKKLVIADRAAPAVAVLRESGKGGAFFLLTILYALQIYADFTGGIDIALGYSEALGIILPENFRRPFFSKNTAEYWRRWHITLGTWMRDYIYYSISVSAPMRRLGRYGRRKWGGFGKRLPVYLATIATWAVTGLWHGLTPNFLLWGMFNCFVLLLSQELAPFYKRFHSRFHLKEKPWYGGFEMVRMFLLMNLIRACDLFPNVSEYFRRLGSLIDPALWRASLPDMGLRMADWGILVLGAGLMLGVSLFQEKRGSLRECLWEREGLRSVLLFLLFLAVLLLGRYGVGYEAANFIYNQF